MGFTSFNLYMTYGRPGVYIIHVALRIPVYEYVRDRKRDYPYESTLYREYFESFIIKCRK